MRRLEEEEEGGEEEEDLETLLANELADRVTIDANCFSAEKRRLVLVLLSIRLSARA